MQNSKVKLFWLIYFCVCLLAMLWPVVKIGNRIEPFILGLPFLLFWFVMLLLLIFFGLLVMFWTEKRGRKNG
jgi:cbb3-type cytochrome oxidase subunit 3